MRKILIFLMVAGLSFVLLHSCNKLDQIIESAVSDQVITVEEAKLIREAFDNDGGFETCQERIDYIMSLAEGMDREIVEQALGCVDEEPLPLAVYVYLDNTQSMRGYAMASNASKFTSVMTGINDYYAKDNITPKAFYTESVTEKGKKQTLIKEIGFDTLRSNLVSNNFKTFTDSYQLNDFFKEVVERIQNDTINDAICFFVTDGIPSGTNEEINPPGKNTKLENRTFNISQKEELQSHIASALRPLGQKGGYGAAIFRFMADFKGEYWKFNNDHGTVLDNQERPFFVIAVAKAAPLRQFVEKVDAGLNNFRPCKSVVFLPSDEDLYPRSEYLEKKDGLKNVFFMNVDQFNLDEGLDDKEGKMKLHINMKSLPFYLRDTTMLAQNVRIEVEGDQVGLLAVKSDRFEFLVPAKETATQKLHIIIEDFLPAWVKLFSSPNDGSLSVNNVDELTKTFNLDIVVKGIEQGIFNKGGEKNAFDIEFTLDSNVQE